MTSVLQDWVMELPLREQGTLLTSVRGCDVAPKNPVPSDDHYLAENGRARGVERELVAYLRWCFMNPADVREVDIPGAFFQSTPPRNWRASQFGHYPQHWYAHIMHGFEVVAYRHPRKDVRMAAFDIYVKFVHNMHLEIEPMRRFRERLSEDRIASGQVVS